MSGAERPRVPRGSPSGGRFAARARPRPGADLLVGGTTEAPDPARLAGASSEQLEAWLDHPDPAVQAEALDSPALTDDQLDSLAEPSRAETLRMEVALDRRPLAGLFSADDPSPPVRAVVAARPDMPETLRSDLLSDPEVATAYRRIPSDPLLGGLLRRARRIGVDDGDDPPPT